MVLRKAPTYTMEERLQAVATMLELGGVTAEAISAVRLQLNTNVSVPTLARWLNTHKDQVTQASKSLAITPQTRSTIDIVRDVQRNLPGDLATIQGMLVDSIKNNPDQMDNASLRD